MLVWVCCSGVGRKDRSPQIGMLSYPIRDETIRFVGKTKIHVQTSTNCRPRFVLKLSTHLGAGKHPGPLYVGNK